MVEQLYYNCVLLKVSFEYMLIKRNNISIFLKDIYNTVFITQAIICPVHFYLISVCEVFKEKNIIRCYHDNIITLSW
jgi:hypothetical protein